MDQTPIPKLSPSLQFYIPATTSILERRPRTLKQGDTFGVYDHYGDIVSGDGSPEGLYHRDTRYLSDMRIFVNGRRPLLLSSTVQDNNAVLTADLTNPDFTDGPSPALPQDTIHIVRSKFLWQATCYERFGLRNYADTAHVIDLSVLFDADFADIFEVRGHVRERRGRIDVSTSGGEVVFTYHGLDAIRRQTIFRFDPEPTVLDRDGAVFRLSVPPGGRESALLSVTCTEGGETAARDPQRFSVCLRQARRALRASAQRAAAVESSNDIFNEVLCRSMSDLYMLMTDTAYGLYPYAGIPWFSTAFGRDGIITAIEMLWLDPSIARGVLQFLAAMQADDIRPESEAEPGKILHEMRQGEMARLGEVPFELYYGSVDSTPLFIVLAGLYFDRTGDVQTVSDLWPHIVAALDWIDEYGDRDDDGFVEYHRAGETGLVNQGWKDSFDSVFHRDGRLAQGSVALCEVQGYVYAAKRHASRIARALGFLAKATTLEVEAERLRTGFDSAFWCDEIGTYALGLDGEKNRCMTRSSNAGQLLFTGIVPDRRAAKVADQLLSPEFFSGWGIRTIGSSEARYNPMSYHNGSIWPHDNALIGFGLARYGFKRHLQELLTAVFNAAVYMDLRRLPELFCGFRRVPGKGPTFYPVACAPQAWSSAAPFALLQACLGLEIDSVTELVRFREPRLPGFLDELTIRALQVGTSRLDILLRRYGSAVSVNVLSCTGNARVEVTF